MLDVTPKPLSNVCPHCHLNGGYHSIHCPNNTNWEKHVVTSQEFEKFIKALFTEEDGQARATTVDGIPYYTYRWGAELDGRDWESFLWDHLKNEFEKLKAKGATHLIWRKRPEVETYHEAETDKKYITLRCRVAALDNSGKQVIGNFVTEGATTPMLHGTPPTPPTTDDGEPVETINVTSKDLGLLDQPKVPNGPVAGYNVVAATAASIVFCAQMCHEVNRAYCEANHDHTQLPWANAPDWARGSAIKGVEFLLQNPKATPADTHQSWCEQKVKDGWMLGPIKDAEKKLHPALVPYEMLPNWQRTKDALFQAVVRSFFGI